MILNENEHQAGVDFLFMLPLFSPSAGPVLMNAVVCEGVRGGKEYMMRAVWIGSMNHQ